MNDVAVYTEAFRQNYDPTHTTVLRNAFARDAKKRFKELANVIKIGVDDRDCFGLKKPMLQEHQMTPPNKEAFDYIRSQEKLSKFMEWLQKQIDAGILTVKDLSQIGTGVEALWTNKYLFDSYKRGVLRARYELLLAGYKIPSLEESGGIMSVLGLPMHIDRIGLIYTRVYSDLKGITGAMDTLISRILAQGIADGDSPRLLAKKLVAAIDGENVGSLGLTDTLGRTIPAIRRAEILARTEIIRAHHLATIQEYRNWGLVGVKVKAEWVTAGDDRVCEKCSALQGKVFTLDEIEPMIPLHPQCRCISIPFVVEN